MLRSLFRPLMTDAVQYGVAAPAKGVRWGTHDIVAWGDSLTASSGTTTNANKYPAVLSTLMGGRPVANQGTPGQTSTEIAARQGGVPIELSVTAATLPELSETLLYDFDFTGSALNGFAAVGTGAVVTATADGMLVEGIGNNIGARKTSGLALPAGSYKTVLDYGSQNTKSAVAIQSRDGANAVMGQIGATYQDDKAVFGTTSGAGTRINIVGSANEDGTGTLLVRRLRVYSVVAVPSVAVTAKSINPLINAGVYTGRMWGRFAGGAEAYVATDASGNWTLYRTTPGSAQALANGSALIPSLAELYRDRTTLIWAGRNNAGAAATVKADIAAMVAYLGHARHLIGSVLTSAADSSGAKTAILALNADLSAIYGAKFVDLMAALQAGGNGSTEDNADIAASLVPRSLRSDDVHLNDAGYAIVAQAYYQKLMQFHG